MQEEDSDAEEQSSKEIDRIVRAVDGIESKIVSIEDELDGIEKVC